ncbi:Beta-galactosidase [Paenibacillus sp. UNC496MF]|uniref:S-layer homology domain-containing protein n=1 Tax=Paenibacillus sp. UNC496MF TaxID=1502753 RepID=UPI0008E04965|nr:S-layer homology domain-containing protein [Paenibacillus sp. UNC496MF]SFI38491.1 Beta-galactosidase [Paenibacillus sp. UNC496MF]
MNKNLSFATAALLALAALSGTVSRAEAAAFKDVPAASPYYAYIDELVALGVVDGIAPGQFGPESTLTRGQFAKLAAEAFRLQDPGGSLPFKDLGGHWAAPYVRAAYKAGIVNGTSASAFSPNAPVKREEAAAMVWRYAKKVGLKLPAAPAMGDKPDAWAAEGVGAAIVHGWHGVDAAQNGGAWTYRPQAAMNRQEAAALIDLSMKDIPGSLAKAGLIDALDDWKQLNDRSNVYLAGNSPEYFGGDGKRATRSTTSPGSVVYHTGYDMTSFQTSSYYFTGIALEKNRYFASADGKTYKEVAAASYPVGVASGSWQQYAEESFALPAKTRYLKVELRGAAKAWSPQLAKVLINRATATVAATTSRGAGGLTVELSTRSQGAPIYYRLNGVSPYRPYTGPIRLTDYAVVDAYAVKDGKEPSPVRTYKLNGRADFTVDAYGQVAAANFPEKVKSDAELKADASADAAYYGGLQAPSGLDGYGGLAGSAAKYGLKGTGYFAIRQAGGRTVMTTPTGDVFFSLGMNGIHADETYTKVAGREEAFEWLPLYDGAYKPAFVPSDSGSFSFYMANKYRKTGKFPTDAAFYAEAVQRLRKWGFNSAGGYSPEQYGKANGFPYVRMLPLDMDWAKLDGISIFDIFAPGAETKLDQAFAKAVAPNKNDPMLIGYFMGNEYDFHKFYDVVPKLKGSAAIKLRLVKLLEDKYQKIGAFNASWGTGFKSFAELKDAALPVSTSASWKDMDQFFRFYLDTFYGTVSRVYRKYDPHHLLLGDRWITTSFHNAKYRDVLAEVEGKYSDAISINYYSYKIETDLLDDVHAKSGGKPVLISEFGYGTGEQGLAPLLPNAAANQFERGMRYRNYVEGVASLGYVVGAHWFNYVDQAATGRYWQGIGDWAEHYNTGILNVADRPYKPFLSGVMQTNDEIYKVLFGQRAKFYYAFK